LVFAISKTCRVAPKSIFTLMPLVIEWSLKGKKMWKKSRRNFWSLLADLHGGVAGTPWRGRNKTTDG
jgi:hypothetical protein